MIARCWVCGTHTEVRQTQMEDDQGVHTGQICRDCDEAFDFPAAKCGCGSDSTHQHNGFACCGGEMCCSEANK